MVILESLLWSWEACCNPLEVQGGLNFPFVVLLAFAQDKEVLVTFILFVDCLPLALSFEEAVSRDLVVVHGGWNYVKLSSWPECRTRLG